MERGMQGQPLELEEGWLALDFANTVEWHASDEPVESLNSYEDLAGWARGINLVSGEVARRLLEEAAERPADAHAALADAIELREAMYRVFAAAAEDAEPAVADLDLINEALSRGLSHLRVAAVDGGFSWGWDVQRDSLHQILWPVARSAAELLTSGELSRLGVCADEDGCGWLFLDTSKNHSRRWCGPGCSNRAKARRHYARVRQARLEDE